MKIRSAQDYKQSDRQIKICLLVVSLVVVTRCVISFLAHIWRREHDQSCNTGYFVCVFACDLVIYGGFGISFWLIWQSI